MIIEKRHKYQLVIVEDEASTRQGLACYFPWGNLGFEVAGAFPSGEEALEYLKQHPCHVVMTDVMMGQMTGLELASQVKALAPDTKIVILSGYSDFAYTRQAIHSKVEEYLLKPIDEDELMAVFGKLYEQLETESAQSESRQPPTAEMLDVVRKSFLRIMLSGQVYSKNELQAYFHLLNIDPRVMEHPILTFEISLSARDAAGEMEGELDGGKLDEIQDVMHQCFVSRSGSLIYDVLNVQDGTWTVAAIALEEMELERLKRHCRDKILSFIERINRRDEYAVFFKITYAMLHIRDLVSDIGLENGDTVIGETVLDGSSQNYHQLLLKSKVLIAGMDLQPELFLRMREDIINSLSLLPFDEAKFLAKSLFSMLLQEYHGRSESLYHAVLRMNDAEKLYAAETVEALESSLRTALSTLNEYVNRIKNENSVGTVGLILRYIEENIGSVLSGDVLAEKFHLHPSYISRVFKQKTGEKFSEYVERLRLEKSILLLYEGNYRIQDISVMVGYISPSYFSAKFRRYTGYAPREYYYQVLL